MLMTKNIDILMIDDSEADVELTTELIKESKCKHNIKALYDGDSAINYFKNNSKKPSVILLDINMPNKNGFEVLDYLKSDEDLRSIPVIMLSTSSNPDDIKLSYAKYANAYMTKPSSLSGFKKFITSFEEFWLKNVSLAAN